MDDNLDIFDEGDFLDQAELFGYEPTEDASDLLEQCAELTKTLADDEHKGDD